MSTMIWSLLAIAYLALAYWLATLFGRASST